MGELFMVMMVPITAIFTTGAVLILRPVTRRIGGLVDAMAQERRERAARPDGAQTRELLAALEGRLSLLEERQDFAEALLDSGRRRPRAALAGRAESAPF